MNINYILTNRSFNNEYRLMIKNKTWGDNIQTTEFLLEYFSKCTFKNLQYTQLSTNKFFNIFINIDELLFYIDTFNKTIADTDYFDNLFKEINLKPDKEISLYNFLFTANSFKLELKEIKDKIIDFINNFILYYQISYSLNDDLTGYYERHAEFLIKNLNQFLITSLSVSEFSINI